MTRKNLRQAVGEGVLPIDPQMDKHPIIHNLDETEAELDGADGDDSESDSADPGSITRAPDYGPQIEPTTLEDLAEALLRPVVRTIKQPKPGARGQIETHKYVAPWPGYGDIRQARRILSYFEEHATCGKVAFEYFNGAKDNAGQMGIACDGTKGAVECTANMPDACIIRAAKEAGDLETITEEGRKKMRLKPEVAAKITSPTEAVEHYFGLSRADFRDPDKIGELREFAKEHCVARVYGYAGPADETPCIIDFIDAGCGIEATDDAWRNSILSLNRGLKTLLLIVTGKFGWGAGSSYQNGDLSIWASVAPGSNKLAFTIVEQAHIPGDRLPTFRFLTVDGKVPVIEKPSWWDDVMMPTQTRKDGSKIVASTILRHVGYKAPLGKGAGENSIEGVLTRSLPDPVLPIWTEYIHMSTSPRGGMTYPGHFRVGRLVRGTLNRLHDYLKRKETGDSRKHGGTPPTKVRHYDYLDIPLGDLDHGGRTGVRPAGWARAEVFVLDPKDGMSDRDTVKMFADPEKCLLFHLSGQTHHEQGTKLVTSHKEGADLAHLGARCVIVVDCNKVGDEAKFAAFGSSREQMKGGEVKRLLFGKIKDWMKSDPDFRRIDGEIATEQRKKIKVRDPQEFAEALSAYLDRMDQDMSFHTLPKRLRKRITVIVEQEVEVRKRLVPPPIPPKLPPDHLEWELKSGHIKMYPGQEYSWVLETNAPEDWWVPHDMLNSPLKVLTGGPVQYSGSSQPKGGRIRVQFLCPETATVGTKGFIQAQYDYHLRGYALAPFIRPLSVEVIEKPQGNKKKRKKKRNGPEKTGEKRTKVIQVPVRINQWEEHDVPLLPPVPITMVRNPDLWARCRWGRESSEPAFCLLVESQKATIYYNEENKAFIDERDALLKAKPGLDEQYVREYEMKLVLEGIFMLNNGAYEEINTPHDDSVRYQQIHQATTRSLAMDVHQELLLRAENEALRTGMD